MMKKLLVLALVLGMTTMASAALQISMNGSTSVTELTVMPSDYITLDISTDVTIGYGLGDWNGSSWFARLPKA